MSRNVNSEIITNPDGSIYHINLHPDQIADDIITVGDPGRVEKVSQHFDNIEHKVAKREFVTHTGTYQGKRMTVISTGIGTDNVDIVLNEIEALANYNLETKRKNERFRKLRFYRLGTSGALISSIDVDSFVISSYGIGLDGLMHFYDYQYNMDEKEIAMKVNKRLHQSITNIKAYVCKGSDELLGHFSTMGRVGFTISASGFYGPQGRMALAKPVSRTFLDDMRDIAYHGQYITNLEMETSGLYGLANMMGHQAISINVILANRETQRFSMDTKSAVENLIVKSLEVIKGI